MQPTRGSGAGQGPVGAEGQAEEQQAAPSLGCGSIGGKAASASGGQALIGTAGVHGKLKHGWSGACSGCSWP